MTSSPARGTTTTTPSSSLSSRSLLSRLKSPLQSKTRNFTDFYIQPDDPHRQYAPGDIISGSVVIKILKPLRITHLVISLHGYAQVFKNPNSPGDAYKSYSNTVGSGKGKKNGSYFGNGFASLFEDEVVLCGEGRLKEGLFHFNFELEFPSKGLPSSIDFERGTISYMLTSTLTRPTTISPTTSCDTKVFLMDIIDIAPPISRRSRPKTARKRPNNTADTAQGPDIPDTTRNGRVSELNSVAEESDGPGSPAPSDVSFESHVSSGNASGTEYGIRSVNTTTDGASQSGTRNTFKGKTITATIRVQKGGFLRGDQVPIKISVSHTKHVRSLKGIIITLYRQARVDMHPALPVAPNSKGDKTKSEDYYPKSRTGLGGLSLSSAGSSHLFRKDLSQSFAPLFVDPRTLTSEVKCAVRVPDEAFPSISNVPGAMISFKYFVEVVVDIQGKLSGLDRVFPNAGLVSVGNTASLGQAEDAAGSTFSTWGGNFADTDALRREKGVISCVFEVVIGTKDSERNGKKKQQVKDAQPELHDLHFGLNDGAYPEGSSEQDYYDYDQDGQYYDHYAYDGAYEGGYYDAPGYQDSEAAQSAYHHPPTDPEAGAGLSEKEQLRRAEARLLPSQPPRVSGPSGPSSPSAVQGGIPASAPILSDDDDPNPPYFPSSSSSQPPPPPFAAPPKPSHIPTMPSIQRRPTNDVTRLIDTGSSLTINANPQQSSTSSTPNDVSEATGVKPLPRLPSPSPAVPGYFASSSSHVQPTDDKQEMQRRRLAMEASAPPEEGHDDDDTLTHAPSASSPIQRQHSNLAPSAPMLDEDDEDLIGAVRAGRGNPGKRVSEALPVYQR
ncbi:hypothetical protein K504DRAFT_476430 [Pleomassaria siparia CBS 279.74]|uniref:Arrestin C-terminal-like domain-containing protein n=1 Tax=Pleomassaria siparia CBS 279.74 TaxID=1314801 RepID=A0A6G1KDB8_9PLEO|nr:hypothetical protein K504DRAFT_476430 [Pleomassaria siparia CBS 279.74]